MLKNTLTVLVVLIMVVVATGCGADVSNDKRVSISFPNTTSSWQRNGDNMRQTLEADGFTVDVKYADTAEQQAEDIKQFIESKTKCLVIGAIDSNSIATVIDSAKEYNVPIIAFDRIIFGTDAVSYYASYDNEAIGDSMGEYLEAAMNLKNGGGPYNIEFFAGAPSDNNAHIFLKNTMAVLEPYLKSGQLICPSKETNFDQVATADWNSANARTRIKKLLDQYYSGGQTLHAVVSPNDDIAGVIIDEMRSRGMAAPIISGLDADPDALTRIKNGQQTFTIGKSPGPLTIKCVRMIKAVVEGTQPEINDVTTYNNGKMIIPSYLCTPQVIDKTNVDEYR